MVVRLTATTTQGNIFLFNENSIIIIGKPLELEELEKVLIACDLILKLDESRQKVKIYESFLINELLDCIFCRK